MQLDLPNRAITGFHQDDEGQWVAELSAGELEGQWVAELSCGHTQHMRHDPPWQVREWVTTEAGRAEKIGTEIPCRLCGEAIAANPDSQDEE